MSVLQHLKPHAVFSFFEQLCRVPHGSGNTDKIAALCVEFAKTRGLRCLRDAANNVVIFKDASAGYEHAEPLILQGHLDMVCAKTPDADIDMTTDGLTVAVDGDWVHAVNTSLGGDNGIAVAMALAILDDDTLPHPPLEVVLTADEETGMDGAFALDMSVLTGRRMLNLDSEEEGVFTVSCAGGLRAVGTLPLTRTETAGVRCTLSVSGLLGGHSGVEIHKGRGNAILLLGRVLYALGQVADFGIAALSGGVVDNAIPLAATAELIVPAGYVGQFTELATCYADIFRTEYATTDSGVTVRFEPHGTATASCVPAARVAFVLTTVPCGVQVMSPDIPNLVQTSLNLGVLRLEENELRVTFSLRSSLKSQKEMLKDRLTCLFEGIGGQVTCSGDYPGWAYRKDSPLRETVAACYRRLFDKEPQIVAIHAGLECGLFCDRLTGLDCVSLGPDMKDIHTVQERLSISSTAHTYQLVLEILKNCR